MPQTCLIAAHDPWFIQLLRIFCEESGFLVVQVYEGQDVLPMLLKEQPVVVMMQADLPGRMKGREVLRQLQADPQAQQVPVVVFTWQGHNQDGAAPAEWLKDAAVFLQEPVTFESFQDALHKAGVAVNAAARPFTARPVSAAPGPARLLEPDTPDGPPER